MLRLLDLVNAFAAGFGLAIVLAMSVPRSGHGVAQILGVLAIALLNIGLIVMRE